MPAGGHGGQPAGETTPDVPVLETYRACRQILNGLMENIADTVLPDEVKQGAKLFRLNQRGGLSANDELDVFMDNVLHEMLWHGKPVVWHYVHGADAETDLEQDIHEALLQSWVSLFRIERVTDEAVIVRDVLDEARPPLRLTDFGLLSSGSPGQGVFFRAIPFEHFVMTSGWSYFVTQDGLENAADKLRRIFATVSHRRRTAEAVLYMRSLR